MEIVLARHAQPDWEPGGLAVDDPGLTPLGHEQAKRAAEELSGRAFDACYTSPLRRAAETARPIADALGQEFAIHSWLSELGLPSMAGFTFTRSPKPSRVVGRASTIGYCCRLCIQNLLQGLCLGANLEPETMAEGV